MNSSDEKTRTADAGMRIRVRGLVQGVGFRPHVWHVATSLGLVGSVCNDGQGVLIEAFGVQETIDQFVVRLRENPPPLSRIDGFEISEHSSSQEMVGFEIIDSQGGKIATGIVPDAATCRACCAEIENLSDRRAGYSFTNCTHCGPRLSILKHIPYDRASTSMSSFQMCEACETEYQNPADRRYHAQPIACPECGPELWLEIAGENQECDNPIGLAVSRLLAGDILAIKGLGGFQIAVDAGNEVSVQLLRQRKRRPDKPFALMVRDIEQVRSFCQVSEKEAKLLSGPAAPILLLEKNGDPLAQGIAPGQNRLGVMLPNTPLHHLLMAKLERPIVLTSGNVSGDPQEIDNQGARQKLGSIVDGFLMHDRDIVNRLDDSVVRIDKSGPAILRRARGVAPAPIRLSSEFTNAPKVLALGGELKSTFCLLNGSDAILSQHIGDLENVATFADYKKMLRLLLELYQFEPDIIAIDKHPQYLSSVYGKKLAAEFGAKLIEVQHHHAHLAACLAEHQVDLKTIGSVFGIILDGLGWGDDGTVWGGEFLKGDLNTYERLAHFEHVPLPGAAAAIREPWRNLIAHLHTVFGENYRDHIGGLHFAAAFEGTKAATVDKMVMQKINSPLSSSAGRLYDAVSAALGFCFEKQSFEGQAAMALEVAAQPFVDCESAYPIDIMPGSSRAISFAQMWQALLDDLQKDAEPGRIAARFHNGLVQGIVRTLETLGAANADTIVLSGGVFQNAILRDGVHQKLEAKDLNVLNHHLVPSNDGGLALGQAVIAARQAMNFQN
ncbi:MAG: carbamoyltransferase HypF [Roseibium sp.]